MKLIYISIFNIILAFAYSGAGLFSGSEGITGPYLSQIIAYAKRPIVNFPGLNQGNRFYVDGPLWYDGDAILEQYNHNHLKIGISMVVPAITMPYKVIDSRINIAIGLVRGSKSGYNLVINDNYGRKNYLITNVRLLNGEIEGGWFSGPKEYIKIVAPNQEYTFIVQGPGRLSLTSSLMPGSLSLIKQ